MIRTIDLEQVTWNHQGIQLPWNKHYSFSHVQIAPHDSTPTLDSDEKTYALSVSRTGEVVCYIRVKPAETNDLHLLQNMMLKSRL